MLPISQIMQTSALVAEPTSPTTLPQNSVKSPETLCIERYGASPKFLEKFNPDLQLAVAANPARAYLGTAPALATIARAYGNNVADAWFAIQLADLAEYSGLKDKGDPYLYDRAARVLRADFGYLKITEIMLCLHRIKGGRYGRLYAFSPIHIGELFREFAKERSADLDYYRRTTRQDTPICKNPVPWRTINTMYSLCWLRDIMVDIYTTLNNIKNTPNSAFLGSDDKTITSDEKRRQNA